MHDAIHGMTDRYRDRRMHSRVNTLDRQNMRLRDEVARLRSDLTDERSHLEDAHEALKRPKVIKKTGVIKLILVGGTAYVLGTRDGRARYEQLVAWARSARERFARNADRAIVDVSDSATEMSDTTERSVRDARNSKV